MLRLKGEVDVLGVQEWDGKGNMHIYQNGFLFATAQNKVFYAYADTPMEKEKWIRAIQMTVETTMPRQVPSFVHSIGDVLSPVSATVMPTDADTKCRCPHCIVLEQVAPGTATPALLYKCYSCDVLYCDKFTSNKVPLPQRSYYYSKRVCDNCYEAQTFINYLKAMVERLKAGICIYPKPLDPETPIELIMPKRPLQTESAKIAIDLLKAGVITAEECEEILLKDRRFYDHNMDHPEIPLDLKILALHREFRSRTFSVYRAVILLHRHLDSDPLLFKPIVEKLLHFSYTRINQVEFYWPQIVHAYLTVPMFDFEKIFWLDELILSICSRSIHLALLLRWQLQGALEDAFDVNAPKEMQDKYARVVRLMVEIEREVAGIDRATILSRDPVSSTKSRLPIPTDDQLQLIVKLTEDIAFHRRNAYESAGVPADVDHYSPVSPTNLSRENTSASMAEMIENAAASDPVDSRFRDFSRFQQHLLTPKEDVGALLLGRGMDGSFDEEDPGIIEEDMIENQPTSIFSSSMRRMSHAEKAVLAKYFSDECDFVEQITAIAEALRFLPSVPERKKRLPGYLEKINLPPMAYVPLVKATDPFERIVRIPAKEGTAFSTKARVPIMLIFEVIRGNMFAGDQQPSSALSPQSPRRSALGSGGIVSAGVEYMEDEEVGRLISHQASEGFTTTESEASDAKEDAVESENTHTSSSPDRTTAIQTKMENVHLMVPETPIDVSCNIATPAAMPAQTAQFIDDGQDPTTTVSSMPSGGEEGAAINMGDLSSAAPTDEAIEREKNRRKDLEAAFGESWSSKRQRLCDLSPYGHLPGWDIVSMIGKSNDDLRQEVFTLQLIQKFIEIFKAANLPIWLKCYRIIATSSSTGLIETLINAISLDGLKKREGYVSLLNHFEKSYGPPDSMRFMEAQHKFIQSMAGYSLVSYFLQIKDRHNGNIMLDNEGRIIHIDYGFLLGIAPGGSFSIETAPFKLTAEMVDTMGGPESEGFKEYVKLCTRGFLACQQHCDEICDLVDVMSRQSPYPCFLGKDAAYILQRLRSRFKLTLSRQDTVAHVLSLVRKSNSNYSTRQYDNFQRMTNGILP